jgi:hypothetical protein
VFPHQKRCAKAAPAASVTLTEQMSTVPSRSSIRLLIAGVHIDALGMVFDARPRVPNRHLRRAQMPWKLISVGEHGRNSMFITHRSPVIDLQR